MVSHDIMSHLTHDTTFIRVLSASSSTRAVRCSAFSLYRVQVLKGAHMHRGVRPDVQPPRLKLARRALLASMVMSLLYGRMGSVSVARSACMLLVSCSSSSEG